MYTAVLHNGKMISADVYQLETDGSRVYCLDKNCRAPVIYVPKSEKKGAHFKTTGKLDSKHSINCAFYEPLGVFEAIQKVTEFQDDLLGKGLKETIIKLNLNRLDPEYEPKRVDRQPKTELEEEESEIKVKDENRHPATISSVKSVAKLLTIYEPDVLASVLLDVGGSRKVPLSTLVINQEIAHDILWTERTLKNVGYFVYGTVASVSRLEKVIYIDFEKVNDTSFTLVVFEKYFKHFTYKSGDLEGYDILVYGFLKKNDYNGKNKTEMVIKSNKYIEKIQRHKNQ